MNFGEEQIRCSIGATVVQQEAYDSFDVEKLKEVIPILRQKLEESTLSRKKCRRRAKESEILSDRCDSAQKEAAEIDTRITAMESRMRLLKEKHEASHCVHEQNIEWLKREHEDITCRTEESHRRAHREIQDHQEQKLNQLKADINELRNRMDGTEDVHIADINSEEVVSEGTLAKMRDELEMSLSNQRNQCNEKLRQLEADLEAIHMSDVNTTNEKWNQHISDLIGNHNSNFQQLKCKEIDRINTELLHVKKKTESDQLLIQNKRKENQLLHEPLQDARANVVKLQEELKDRAKDNLSLFHAKRRIRANEQKIVGLKEDHAKLLMDFERAEEERNDLYELFQNALSRVRDQTDSQQLLLERKIENAEESIETSALQLEEMAIVAGISNQDIESITESFDKQLDPLNSQIINLQHKLADIRKAYSSSMNTYLRELRKEGVPEDKIGAIFTHKAPEGAMSTHVGLLAAT